MFLRNFNFDMRGGYPGAINLRNHEIKVGDIQQPDLTLKFFLINAEREQSAQDHVPARPRKAIEIQCSHKAKVYLYLEQKKKRVHSLYDPDNFTRISRRVLFDL